MPLPRQDPLPPPRKRRRRLSPQGPGWDFVRRATQPQRRRLYGSLAAALVSALAKLSVPLLVAQAVDVGILQHHRLPLGIYAAVIALVGVVQGVAAGCRRWLNGLASRHVEAELREQFFDHLLRLDIGYHDQVNRGQLLSRVASDLFQVKELVASLPAWIANAVLVVAVGVVLVVTQPLLGLVAVVGLPWVVLFSKQFSATVRPALADLQRERGDMAGVVEETLTGIRAVKGFGAEGHLESRLRNQAARVLDQALQVVDTRARFNPQLAAIPMVALVAVNWLGGYLVIHHSLTVGSLLAFNVYLVMITGPLRSVGAFIVQAQRAEVSGKRLAAVTSRRSALPELDAPEPLPDGGGEIVFKQVSFSYSSSSSQVLSGVDLHIRAGEVVALVGPTGSGKTTLAALVARFYDPDTGSVSLEGIDLRHLALADLRKAVGVVFDESFLFEESVRDNLAVAAPHASEEDMWAALALAAADEMVRALPAGIDTVVGERGLSLSGGQRQRIALARAILADPRVLILDDATSAVDASKERQIVRSLSGVMQGRTTIIISHRPATIALSDRVVVLDKGRVSAVGRHDELLRTSRRYRKIIASKAPPSTVLSAQRPDSCIGGAGVGGAGVGDDSSEGDGGEGDSAQPEPEIERARAS